MSARSRSLLFGLSLASVILVGSTMRSPIVGLSGVLERIVADLNLSALVAGSLTTIPVLAFAVCTPIAAYLIRRTGYKFCISLTLLGVALGIVVRSIGSTPLVILGTALIGLAITLGNVTMPVLIRARFTLSQRAVATALYTTALNMGAMLMLLTVVPLANALGWRWALGLWAAHSLSALAVWMTTVGVSDALRVTHPARTPVAATAAAGDEPAQPIEVVREASDAMVGTDPTDPAYRKDLRFRLVIMTIAFGFQSFGYYSVTAWLPQILGAKAGLAAESASSAASVFQMTAVIGAFGIPLLARRVKYSHLALGLATMWITFALGMLGATSLWGIWLVLGGAAQGGTFTLIMILMVQLAKNDAEAAKFSATIQGIAYTVAALGPTLLGFAFDKTGSWDAPLYLVLGAISVLAVTLFLTTRDSAHIRYKK